MTELLSDDEENKALRVTTYGEGREYKQDAFIVVNGEWFQVGNPLRVTMDRAMYS